MNLRGAFPRARFWASVIVGLAYVLVLLYVGAITFRDIAGKLTVLRITCDKCGCSGRTVLIG